MAFAGAASMLASLRERIQGSGTVTVFLSSPFRGMQEERTVFVERYLPHLRAQCEAVGVHLKLVDLRWGITEKEMAEHLTLQICLQEIDRCDIFVGCYGNRYGTFHSGGESTAWVDKAMEAASLRYPWVKEWAGRGFTELEFRHGCMNDTELRPSMFFFRDRAYDAAQAAGAGGAGDYKNGAAGQKLRDGLEAELVDLGRSNPQVVVESYADPEEGALKIYECVTGTLDCALPDPVERKDSDGSHRAFAQSRRHLYVGGDVLMRRLSDTILSPSSAGTKILISGASGSGKSSLISNWLASHARQHPDDVVVAHYTGCDPASTHLRSLLLRMVQTLARTLASVDIDASSATERLSVAFGASLRAVGAQLGPTRRLIIAVDAVNQLSNDKFGWLEGSHVHAMGWMPRDLPSNVHIVCSALPGPAMKSLLALGFAQFEVTPLSGPEQRQFITEKCREWGAKTVAEDVQAQITANPQAQNPLFLSLLLDELITFGSFEELQAKATELCSQGSIPALLEVILARVERTFAAGGRREAVSDLFSLIGIARHGVWEDDLKAILGFSSAAEPGLSSFLWSTLYFAVRHLLVEKASGFTFLHDHIRAAVQRRYLGSEAAAERAHRKLAAHLSLQFFRTPSGEPNGRLLDLPYHQLRAGLLEDCVATLCNIEFLDCKCEAGHVYDLIQDHRRCAPRIDAGHPLSDAFHDFWSAISNQLPLIRRMPECFLSAMANQPEATSPSRLAQQLLEADDRPWVQWLNKEQERSATKLHLEGHRAPVYCCASAPGAAQLVASGDRSGKIRIWSLESGDVERVLSRHTEAVNAVAFASDSLLFSASDDGTIGVWVDLEAAEPLRAGEGCVQSLHVPGDRACLLSCHSRTTPPMSETSSDATAGCVVLWALPARTLQAKVECVHGLPLHAIFAAPDRSAILVEEFSPRAGTLKVVAYASTGDGAPYAPCPGPSIFEPLGVDGHLGARERALPLQTLALTRDQRVLAHAEGPRVGLFERGAEAGAWGRLAALEGHTSLVLGVQWSPVDVLATCGADHLILLWSSTGTLLRRFLGHVWKVFCVAHPSDHELISGSGVWDKRLLVWDCGTAQSEQGEDSLPPHFGEGIASGCVSMDRTLLLSNGHGGRRTFQFWDLGRSNKRVRVVGDGTDPELQSAGNNPAISYRNDHVYVGNQAGKILCLEQRYGSWERSRSAVSERLAEASCGGDVTLTPDGRFLCVGGQQLKLYDLATGDCVVSFPTFVRGRVVCCSPSSKRIVLATAKCAQVWCIQPMQPLAKLEHEAGESDKGTEVLGVAYAPDGRRIATSAHSGEVAVWSATDFQRVSSFHMWDRAYRVAFTLDAEFVICAGDDKTIALFTASTGQVVTRLYVGAGVGFVGAGLGCDALVAGDDLGRVLFLSVQNVDFGVPIVTPTHYFDSQSMMFSDGVKLLCPWTGKYFDCPERCRAYIAGLTVRVDCPAARLSEQTFQDSNLLIKSPFTGLFLRVNPFAVDHRRGISVDEEVARALMEEIPLDVSEEVYCVKIDRGSQIGQLQWVGAADMFLDARPLTAGEGRQLGPGHPVAAVHPAYEPMWDARLGQTSDDETTHIEFLDGDEAHVPWAEVVLPVPPTADDAGAHVWVAVEKYSREQFRKYMHGRILCCCGPERRTAAAANPEATPFSTPAPTPSASPDKAAAAAPRPAAGRAAAPVAAPSPRESVVAASTAAPEPVLPVSPACPQSRPPSLRRTPSMTMSDTSSLGFRTPPTSPLEYSVPATPAADHSPARPLSSTVGGAAIAVPRTVPEVSPTEHVVAASAAAPPKPSAGPISYGFSNPSGSSSTDPDPAPEASPPARAAAVAPPREAAPTAVSTPATPATSAPATPPTPATPATSATPPTPQSRQRSAQPPPATRPVNEAEGAIRSRLGSVRGKKGSVKKLLSMFPGLSESSSTDASPSHTQETGSEFRSRTGTLVGIKGRVSSSRDLFRKKADEALHGKSLKQKLEEAEAQAGKQLGGKIVIYTSSLSIIGNTKVQCRQLRKILQLNRLPFEERDVTMCKEFHEQLNARLPGASVPELFLNGEHFGNAERVFEFNETGQLKDVFKGVPKIPDSTGGVCQSCHGRGFYPCSWCGGDKQSMYSRLGSNLIKLRCTACNENGLMKCTACMTDEYFPVESDA